MVTPVLLFDMGETLVGYYRREEFPPILQEAIQQVTTTVLQADFSVPSEMDIAQRVRDENYEARNHRVRPLEQRLMRIFGLRAGTDDEVLQAMCRAFLMPIFSKATLYADTLPALAIYRKQGYPIGIVSNCPWGSPGTLWREELKRLGLLDLCDMLIFCTQVGWRKPAQPMFRRAVKLFACRPQECLFVGDHPRWDVIGARRAGMFPVLVDRTGSHRKEGGECWINSLWGLEAILQQWEGAHHL